MEYGPLGVRINLVSPGRIVTPMMISARIGSLEAIAETLPARRMGEPTDVAAAVLWLSSPQAGFVIGHDLHVDGGFCAT
jgi:NAD(P)-dependent dehydrogenase (short-subunit alcohol dehydrogenase family)